MIATIGYEKSRLADFLQTLEMSGIEILIDIRDRAQSRVPGFSKSALSEAVQSVGINYTHLKALGDPKEGREAARSGDYDLFRKVFNGVLETAEAKFALQEIIALAQCHKICLMCYERDQRQCHRKIVSDYLEQILGCKTQHLGVRKFATIRGEDRRVLHTYQSAAA